MNYCSICGKEIPDKLTVCSDCAEAKKESQKEAESIVADKPKRKKKTKKAKFDFNKAVREADELFEGIEIGETIFAEAEEQKEKPATAEKVRTEESVGFSMETLLFEAERKAEKPADSLITKQKAEGKKKSTVTLSDTKTLVQDTQKPEAKETETDLKSEAEEKAVEAKPSESVVSEKVLRLFESQEESEPEAKTEAEQPTRGKKLSSFFKGVKKMFFEDTEEEASESLADKGAETEKETEIKIPKDISKEEKISQAVKSEAPPDENNATLFDLDIKEEKVELTAKKREREGILERELDESEGEDEEDKRYGKTVITIAAVIVALLVGLLVYAAATAAKGEPVESNGIMLEYLTGEWLSEGYAYEKDETIIFREFLIINADETFKMVYYIDDGVSSEGYRDGTWKVNEEINGIVAFDETDSSVHLRFSQQAQNQEYIRYLLNTSDESMTLREYYNKTKTDFYDVEFKKVG